jgi:trans-aconitate 2-methyltransferase
MCHHTDALLSRRSRCGLININLKLSLTFLCNSVIMNIMEQWNAVDYHKNSADQQRWGLELLDKIALSGNERVLDVGCGDGKLTAEIVHRVPYGSVLGIDKPEDMIRFAQEYYQPDVFPNLKFLLLDARNLYFDQEFDVVFSNAALYWVDDHANILLKIRGSLSAGGRVIAQMGGKGNASGILKVLDTMIRGEKWADYFSGFSVPYTFYDDQEYKMLLESAGLTVKRIELIPKHMVHNGQEGLAAWIRTTWLPYTRRVSENFQSDFILEIVNTYIKVQALHGSGIIPVEMVRLEFEAEREVIGK